MALSKEFQYLISHTQYRGAEAGESPFPWLFPPYYSTFPGWESGDDFGVGIDAHYFLRRHLFIEEKGSGSRYAT